MVKEVNNILKMERFKNYRRNEGDKMDSYKYFVRNLEIKIR